MWFMKYFFTKVKDGIYTHYHNVYFVLLLSLNYSISVLLSSGRRRKSKATTSKKEENLLRELRQITQFMQEGRLEAASPEMEAEEVPYGSDWEGIPKLLTK